LNERYSNWDTSALGSIGDPRYIPMIATTWLLEHQVLAPTDN
jgi:hypothetical protein